MSAAAQEWLREALPFDLGDDEHRWSYLMRADGGGKPDMLWLHRCVDDRPTLSWIDVTSGQRHRLVNDDPEHLTVEASVLCPVGCGDHGFIRDGKWVAA